VGVKLIVLGFAPLTRLPRERLASDNGAPCLRPAVGPPLPGEPALHGHDPIVALGREDAQKCRGRRRQILMDQLRTVRTAKRSLARTMRSLLTGYAGGFNRRHRRGGHLFQNRYKSISLFSPDYRRGQGPRDRRPAFTGSSLGGR
jgi:hypothetical protein